LVEDGSRTDLLRRVSGARGGASVRHTLPGRDPDVDRHVTPGTPVTGGASAP